MSKNGFRLNRKTSRNSYDWWWHSFVASHSETGELKPFFIEYYVINPGLWKGEIIWGQQKANKENKVKPCYAMLKVGTWGEDKIQLHNFYDISDFHASRKKLECTIGSNKLDEYALSGEVSVTEQERDAFPERMSDAGSLKWDLSVEKDLQFDVGYGSSKILAHLNVFHMYWHVQGMRCRFAGKIILNHEEYDVHPETSYGYQDKNWGRDYTNPWIWLNCNNFYSKSKKKNIDASLDIGGGCPRVFGVPLDRRILTALYYDNQLIEFNFSKFWKKSKQFFNSYEDSTHIYWEVISENRTYKMDVKFKCDKSKMLLVNYESPKGEKKHNKLWNGGHAEGVLKLYKKEAKGFKLIDELTGALGGCEYGEYDESEK